MLYLQSRKCLYGAMPNVKHGLLYISLQARLWAAEQYGEPVEIKGLRKTNTFKKEINNPFERTKKQREISG